MQVRSAACCTHPVSWPPLFLYTQVPSVITGSSHRSTQGLQSGVPALLRVKKLRDGGPGHHCDAGLGGGAKLISRPLGWLTCVALAWLPLSRAHPVLSLHHSCTPQHTGGMAPHPASLVCVLLDIPGLSRVCTPDHAWSLSCVHS